MWTMPQSPQPHWAVERHTGHRLGLGSAWLQGHSPVGTLRVPSSLSTRTPCVQLHGPGKRATRTQANRAV